MGAEALFESIRGCLRRQSLPLKPSDFNPLAHAISINAELEAQPRARLETLN
jgi:hypothetical protein